MCVCVVAGFFLFFPGGWGGGGQSKFIDKLISAFVNEFAGGLEIFGFCLKNVRHVWPLFLLEKVKKVIFL